MYQFHQNLNTFLPYLSNHLDFFYSQSYDMIYMVHYSSTRLPSMSLHTLTVIRQAVIVIGPG